MDTGERITTILKETGARDVLDVGCGRGALARRLVGEGLAVTGIDPTPDAIAAAQESVPEAQFSVAGAEALPFDPGSFDACVFLNSLHHVPVPLMGQALQEALRVLRPGGEVIVVEPLAEGPFFEVMRPVEDETEIRRAAMAAIDAAMASGMATGPAPRRKHGRGPHRWPTQRRSSTPSPASIPPDARWPRRSVRPSPGCLPTTRPKAPKAPNFVSPCASGDCDRSEHPGKLALD